MRFTAVLFDLDGTLIDSAPGIAACLRDAIDLALPGQAPKVEVIERLIGPPVHEMLRRVLPDADESVHKSIIVDFRHRYDNGGWRHARAYKGARRILAWLNWSSVRCFVVTNKPAMPTRLLLAHFKLQPYFACVVSPDSESKRLQTKSDALRNLRAQYALQSSSSLYVGDSPDDGAAARENGLAFAAAQYGYGWQSGPDFPADFLLNRLGDLRTILGPRRAGAPMYVNCSMP